MTSPPERPPCTVVPLIENDRMRVTRYDFVPGAETGWRVNAVDHLVVTLTDCPMRLELSGGGMRDMVLATGSAHTRPAGTGQNIINGGTTAMSFVEIELKPAP